MTSGEARRPDSAAENFPTADGRVLTETFVIHDLIEREGSTTPDESRGRESLLSYEAVVSAV